MIQQTAADLGAYLEPLIQGAFPNMKVLWDNDGQERPPEDQAFVRIRIAPSGESPAALGNRVWRMAGVVIVQVFTPVGTGDGPANLIADQFKAWLRGKSVGAIQFSTVYIVPVGLREAFYQLNLNAEFSRDGA